MEENDDKLNLRELALLEAGDSTQLVSVIEKELIHYDILRAMSENGFLKDLCFQGGTALRLCYQSDRFSEDLDFTGGVSFTAENMHQLKTCIEDSLSKRYGLSVEVKEPKIKPDSDINVSAWQVKVITAPERRDIPSQKIKIEVANIPSYTKEFLQLLDNYRTVGNAPLIVPVQSLEEIMADKLVALPNSINNIRYRDLWDLHWMAMRRTTPNLDFIQKKVNDYKVDDYQSRLQSRIDSLDSIINGNAFKEQMMRFLHTKTIESSIDKPEFRQALQSSLMKLLSQCEGVSYRPSNQYKP